MAKKKKAEESIRKELEKKGFFARFFGKGEKLSRKERRALEREENKGEEKKKRLQRGMDSVTEAIAWFKYVFSPDQKPALVPEKYERPIYNFSLRSIALAISTFFAFILNLIFLLVKRCPRDDFLFELVMLTLLFAGFFFILIRLGSFFFQPFSYESGGKFKYSVGGESFFLNAENNPPFNFGIRLGDLLFKKYERAEIPVSAPPADNIAEAVPLPPGASAQ